MTYHWKLAEHNLRARLLRSYYESGELAAWVLLSALMLLLVYASTR